jgi:hypothetical protein
MRVIGKILFATSCAVLATLAIAQTSREQVKAEARAANKAGNIPQGEQSYNASASQPKSTKTRAQGKAEMRAAIARGEVDHGGEASPNENRPQKPTASRNRAEVKAETKEAVKRGQIPHGDGQ